MNIQHIISSKKNDMGKLIVIALVLISEAAFSQMIKTSELDKFENKQRIETRGNVLGMGPAARIAYRSIGETIFLNFVSQRSAVVGSDSPLLFLFDDGSQLRIMSKDIQSSRYTGAIHVADFEYYITHQEVKDLAEKTVTAIRWYTTESYEDIEVNKKNSQKINELARTFLEEYSKHNLTAQNK